MTRGARFWLALWGVYLIWGSTYLGIGLAGETIPPIFAAGVRFLVAGSIMAGLVLLASGRAPFRLPRRELASAALVGVVLTSANALLFVAERDVPTGVTALIFASVPLWIVLLRTLGGDRPAAASLAGTAAGFAGVAILLRPSGEATAVGLLLVVVAAGTWAAASFTASRLPMPPDARVVAAVEMLAGGVVLLPLGIALRGDEPLDPTAWSGRSLFGLAYLVVFGSLVGFTAYVWLIGNAPIGTVATYAYVNPVVAILLGTLVLSEALTLSILAGAAVVLASVAAVIRRESRPPPPP